MNFLINKKWVINKKITEDAGESLVSQILNSRGISSAEEVKAFLHPRLGILNDPFLLNDMKEACSLISNAVTGNDAIIIFGDYDVDGVSATALLLLFLKEIKANVSFMIPDRIIDGYGLSSECVDKIISAKYTLVITVDNGISAIDEIRTLRNAGIKVIVTDHHECKEFLPEANAVINPKRPDSNYPFRHLAGVGVALKLVQALSAEFKIPDAWMRYVDICALGTVGDMVPLTDENRMIVYHGLAEMNKGNINGLRILFNKVSHGQGLLTSSILGFTLAPRINAAGRMGDCSKAVQLLTETDSEILDSLAIELIEANSRRQEIENQIFIESKEIIQNTYDFASNKIIVVYKIGWHQGVLGIVASKLAEYFGRTVFVFSGTAGIYKGSARSGDTISVLEAIEFANDLVLHFGGHKKAAGLEVEEKNMKKFITAVQSYSEEKLRDKAVNAEIQVDFEIPNSLITVENAISLTALEPFGEENRQPLFVSRNLRVLSMTSLSEGKHTKFILKGDDTSQVEAVDFGHSLTIMPFLTNDFVDVVFQMKTNSWREKLSVQVIVKDMYHTSVSDDNENSEMKSHIFHLESVFATNPSEIRHYLEDLNIETSLFIPEMDDFGTVYKFIFDAYSEDPVFCDSELLSDIITSRFGICINSFKLMRILEIFSDVGIAELNKISSNNFIIKLVKSESRAKLSSSKTYRELRI